MADVCGLPIPDQLEGASLRPLLDDPDAVWDRPALTTHGFKNHALRNERWRYIRYADGSEELYDHDNDPLEWHNLADDTRFADVKQKLASQLPQHDAESVVRNEP